MGIGVYSKPGSRFIDLFLMQHVTSLLFYIKDTPDLLCTLEGVMVPQGATLVAVNVEALYSSILHDRGLHIISSFLQEMDRSQWPLNQFILDLLDHLLHCNVFLYAGSHYPQVQGVAMGTCCVPSYAKLYLGGGRASYLLGITCQCTCATFCYGTGTSITSSWCGCVPKQICTHFSIYWRTTPSTSILYIWCTIILLFWILISLLKQMACFFI